MIYNTHRSERGGEKWTAGYRFFHGVMIFALSAAAKAAGRVEGAQQEKDRQKRPGPKKGPAAHLAKTCKEADEAQPLFRAMGKLDRL